MSAALSAHSIIQPRRTAAPGWQRATWWVAPPSLDKMGYPVEAWENPKAGLFVLSAVEVAVDPGQPELGPEYHLSMSRYGERCSSADALFVLHAFDLVDAQEDNHVPSGKVRNFWRPVADHLSGYECPCVDEEPAIREDNGDFLWRGITR